MKLIKGSQEEKQSFFHWGFQIFDKWLQIKNGGRSLTEYFEDNEIHNVAIYGLGAIGRRLLEELRQGQVEVLYGIDRNAAGISIEGLELKTLGGNLPKVDAIVVTPIAFYDIQRDIYRSMGKDVDVIFIEELLEYCMGKDMP